MTQGSVCSKFFFASDEGLLAGLGAPVLRGESSRDRGLKNHIMGKVMVQVAPEVRRRVV